MSRTPSILVANGVNLDLLGKREAEHYGRFTLATMQKSLTSIAPKIAALMGFRDVKLDFFQSNDEAAFLAKIGESCDGILINPGAWTHTSLALADRLAALKTPFVEIHISNLSAREDFRKRSFAAPHATGVVYGLGEGSYSCGLFALLNHLASSN